MFEDFAVGLHCISEAVKVAPNLFKELADIFELHTAADVMEVEPFKRNFLMFSTALVRLRDIFRVRVANDGLGIVLLHEVHEVD